MDNKARPPKEKITFPSDDARIRKTVAGEPMGGRATDPAVKPKKRPVRYGVPNER